VARLLLWHGEQGGTPGAMGSVEKAVLISSPHPQGPVRLVPGTILDVGDVRMGLEYPP